MIGVKDLVSAGFDLRLGNIMVPWDDCVLAHSSDRAFGIERSVTVDDEARIHLTHEGGVEAAGKLLRQAARTHVPRDMSYKLGVPQAQLSEPAGEPVTGVIANEQIR